LQLSVGKLQLSAPPTVLTHDAADNAYVYSPSKATGNDILRTDKETDSERERERERERQTVKQTDRQTNIQVTS